MQAAERTISSWYLSSSIIRKDSHPAMRWGHSDRMDYSMIQQKEQTGSCFLTVHSLFCSFFLRSVSISFHNKRKPTSGSEQGCYLPLNCFAFTQGADRRPSPLISGNRRQGKCAHCLFCNFDAFREKVLANFLVKVDMQSDPVA